MYKFIFMYKCTSITCVYMLKYSTYLKYINKIYFSPNIY